MMRREVDHHAEVRRVAGRLRPDALARAERLFSERMRSVPSATRVESAFGVADARFSVLVVPGPEETEIRAAGSKRDVEWARAVAAVMLATTIASAAAISLWLARTEGAAIALGVGALVCVAALAAIELVSRRRAKQTKALADALVDALVDREHAPAVRVAEEEEAFVAGHEEAPAEANRVI